MIAEPADVQIICCPGGPMLVRGAAEIIDDHGVAHATSRPVVAICRCGKSSRSPWCDGTHKLVGPRRQATPDASGAAAGADMQR